MSHRFIVCRLEIHVGHLDFFFFFAVLGLHCCTQAFSGCGERGLLFCCSPWASHCIEFSCCGARALGTWASVVAAQGLSSCGSQALELAGISSCGTSAR